MSELARKVRALSLLAAVPLALCGCRREGETWTDYCALLARDIAGKQHGFLAGNHLYYVGGQANARWQITEHETLGFTHPMFRDGRARGHGIATGAGGTGHDKWGWEFWRKVRAAYGSVVVDGQRCEHPAPVEMVWRPDRQLCRYKLGDLEITETKFISLDDVLCSLIRVSRPAVLEFDGQSFVNTDNIPTRYGDPPNTTFSQKRTATAEYDPRLNAIHITEGGTIMTKLDWDAPAVEGRLMYDGLSVVLAASESFARSHTIRRDAEGRQVYRFRVRCSPEKDLALAYAMGDDYDATARGVRRLLADPRAAMEAKTAEVNRLLNTEIPRFRCSDPDVVRTYYYLWSLYFLYFTHTGKGWEQYPHTQTAVNNFMGLHLWDSWAYAAMGCWVADKWSYAFGNVLSWKFMVPFRNKQDALPDNFGVAWHSPGVWMNFVGTVEPAWRLYEQSGDEKFLRQAYDELYRKLYWNGPQRCYGIEINALDALGKMANALGRRDDAAHWQSMRPALVERFKRGWQAWLPCYYAGRGTRYKDIWHLASMLCREMPDQWADAMVRQWVMNREKGFLGPVPLRIRPPDSPQNGVFAVSTMSTWLAVEGMFRHHCDREAIACTLGHIRGMLNDYGHPVAPECWSPSWKPWGDMYYNWCGAINDLLLSRIAGIHYSIPEQELVVCDHLPEGWDYVEVRVPIVLDGRARWTTVRTRRRERGGRVEKTVRVEGCPLRRLTVQPWLEGREVVSSSLKQNGAAPRGHAGFSFERVRGVRIRIVLGERPHR